MRFQRSSGITPSETILADLCDRSFLTLWCYPNLFRKTGKELCDALVVFGDDVIIFSDKSCAYPNTGDAKLDWSRWYRRSLAESAHQLSRAESWLVNHPDRVYLDANCSNALPIALPKPDRLRAYRVCIALGASQRSEIETGKPALTVSAEIQGDDQRFTVGKITEARGWVHVFDDHTLPVVLNELSTIVDFLDYLRKKEALFDSGKFSHAETELDLLGYFLWYNRQFPIPANDQVRLEGRIWQKVESDPQFLAAREKNKVSYLWDRIIEYFADHYMKEQLEFGNEIPVGDLERAVRVMAAEDRFSRRLLAKWILARIEPPSDNYLASMFPSLQQGILYVLLIGPGSGVDKHPQYRRERLEQLYTRCIAAKAVHR